MTKVFSAQATDGNSTAFEFGGGPLMMVVQLVSGTGTIKGQMSPDGTTWIDIEGMSVIASGTKAVPHLPKCQVRANLSSSGGGPSFNVWMGQ